MNEQDVDRIIEMAWEDRTSFDAIEQQFGLQESQVIELMRKQLRRSSFLRWRRRVSGRKTKHAGRREAVVTRFRCARQRDVSNNKISKRL
jgi:uncharacterized protein (TIGR03643 family)